MAQQSVKAKLNYKPKSSIEVFYSGGAVSLSKHGLLACACQDEFKVLMVAFRAVQKPLSSSYCWSSTTLQCVLELLQIVDTLSGAVIKTLSGVR